MLKLLARQIARHWKGLLPVLLLWIAGGYYIFHNKHSILTSLAHFAVKEPAAGEQFPEKARPFVEHAREETHGIRLDLMEKACVQIPLRYRGESELFQPHWLERYEKWNLQTNREIPPRTDDVVEPDSYWKENRPHVIRALKDTLAASVFAFEIPPAEGSKEGINVADETAKYARAACMDPIIVFMYGDYAEHLEARARLKIVKADKDFELNHPSMQDQELYVLESLKNSDAYKRALASYMGGPVPITEKACTGREYRLACVAPEEAAIVMRKRIYVADSAELPALFINLAKLHMLGAGEDHKARALDYFYGGIREISTEKEARAGLARAYMALDKVDRAYEQIAQASLLYRDHGRTDNEFRELARSVLMKAGKFREADCYSDYSDLPSGERDYCVGFKLQ